jgi:nicotinate phosphoribosyltransferase
MVLAAGGRALVDFGLRRAHGLDAADMAARASFIAGFRATATVTASMRFGIPASGTMAHSFIQAHDDETEAFRAFAEARPDGAVLLLDTYDPIRAAHRVAGLAPALAAHGVVIKGVRLDSGDIAAQAHAVRRILDDAQLPGVDIFASGNMDEDRIHALADAPIDGFGVGTSLAVPPDAPSLDCVYKLQEYDGRPRRKRSEGKATWPGRKQVFRRYDGDLLTTWDDPAAGRPLLVPVLRGGKRVAPLPALDAIRAHAVEQVAGLPEDLRRLDPVEPWPVAVSERLRDLAAEYDQSN